MSEFLLRVPNLFQEKCGERWKFNDLTAGGYGNLCFCIADYGWGVQGGCCYKQWFACFMSCTPSIDMGSKAPKVRKSALKEWKMLVFWGENHWSCSFCSVEMSMVKVQKNIELLRAGEQRNQKVLVHLYLSPGAAVLSGKRSTVSRAYAWRARIP